MITDKERQSALDALARTRQTVLDAVEGVSDAQARWKPSPERWSILEYMEHLAISEDRLIALIHKIVKEPARPETEEQRRERLLDARALMRDLVIEAGYDVEPLTEDEARRVEAHHADHA